MLRVCYFGLLIEAFGIYFLIKKAPTEWPTTNVIVYCFFAVAHVLYIAISVQNILYIREKARKQDAEKARIQTDREGKT